MAWIAAGVTIGSALLGAHASKKAGQQQANAADQAAAESARQYDLSRSDAMPWMQAGQGALSNLQNPGASFQASPGYQWRVQQGQNNLGNSFAARGGAFSGNALKALTDYNQNQASSEFGNWWNQQAGLAGVGQAATQATGVLGANAANMQGNYAMQAGDARSSGLLGSTASLLNGANGFAGNWLYRGGPGGGSRNTLPPWGYGGGGL
jgi:hypothetical protein